MNWPDAFLTSYVMTLSSGHVAGMLCEEQCAALISRKADSNVRRMSSLGLNEASRASRVDCKAIGS